MSLKTTKRISLKFLNFKKIDSALLFLIFLFILTRLIILFASGLLIWQGEEPLIGTLSVCLSKGWVASLWDFQIRPYNGGSIVNALFLMPFFAVFGPKILAVKIAALFFHLLGMIVLFFLMKRHFSRLSALLGCLLYIFAPALVVGRSLIFNGALSETIVLSNIILYVFFNLTDDNSSKKWHVVFGLVSGFSFWYCYGTLVTIIACVLGWVIKEKKGILKENLKIYLICFFVGMIPWFIYNSKNNFAGFLILKDNISNVFHVNPLSFFLVIKDLFFMHLIKMYLFDEFSLKFGGVLNWFYYISFLSAYFLLFFEIISVGKNMANKDNSYIKKITLLLLPLIFVVFYLFGYQRFGTSGRGLLDYRYALLLFPGIFMILALSFDRFWTKTAVAKILFFAIILSGLFGSGRFIYSTSFNNKYLQEYAYNYELAGMIAFRRYGDDIKPVKIMLAKLKDNNAINDAYAGYGAELSLGGGGIKRMDNYLRVSSEITIKKHNRWFLRGVGWGLIQENQLDHGYIENIASVCSGLDIDYIDKAYLFMGIINKIFLFEHFPLQKSKNILPVFTGKYENMAHFFYGIRAGVESARDKDIQSWSVEGMSEEYREYYYYGFFAGLSEFFSGDIDKIQSFIEKSKVNTQKYLWPGSVIYYYKKNHFTADNLEKNFPDKYKKMLVQHIEATCIYDELFFSRIQKGRD